MSRRPDIRAFLIEYLQACDDPQTVEDCVNAYVLSRNLGARYHLKPSETKTSKTTSSKERVRLRDQTSQELGVMKQMGMIRRVRYGVYVKRLP